MKRLKKSTSRPLARGLLGTVLVLAMNRCVLPHDYQLLPEMANREPRILGINPAQIGHTINVGPGCGTEDWMSEVFEAYVKDPDLKDEIRNRWFVDPNPQHSTESDDGSQLRESSKPERDTPVKSPPNLVNNTDLKLPGRHVLELVIADAEFDGASISTLPKRTVALPDGGVVQDVGYTDSVIWLIDSVLEPCP